MMMLLIFQRKLYSKKLIKILKICSFYAVNTVRPSKAKVISSWLLYLVCSVVHHMSPRMTKLSQVHRYRIYPRVVLGTPIFAISNRGGNL